MLKRTCLFSLLVIVSVFGQYTFQVGSESVLDFCMIQEDGLWKYKCSAISQQGLVTFSLGAIPDDAYEIRTVFNYYVEKSYGPDNTILCYALVNKIPGDNYSYYTTHPVDLFYLGPGESAVLVDQFASSFEGPRSVNLYNWQVITDYISMYKTLTILWVTTIIGIPTVRIASPLAPISSRRPFITVRYSGSQTPAQLVVNNDDIKFTPYTPLPGFPINTEVTIHNYGALDAYAVDVELWDGSPFNGGNLLASQILMHIAPAASATAYFDGIFLDSPSRHRIYAVVGRNYLGPEISNRTHIAWHDIWLRNDYTLYRIDFEDEETGEWWEKDDNLLSINYGPPEETQPHPPQIPSYMGIRHTSDDNHTRDGTRCLEFFFNGYHDDGSKWIYRPIPVDIPEGMTKEITVSFYAKDRSTDRNHRGIQVLRFCDIFIPETETDFTPVTQMPGTWFRYSYSKQFSGPFKGEVYTGVGFRVNITAGEIREFVDDIDITVQDVVQQPAK